MRSSSDYGLSIAAGYTLGKWNHEVMVGRTTIFGVLLVPAISLAALSLWTFEAGWIGLAVFVVGFMVAALGSARPLKTAGLLLLLAVQVAILIATAFVGFAIDCSRHCS
jgi:hypothetical protein